VVATDRGEGQGLGLDVTTIDWNEINAEVDEFLNETDDEDDSRSVRSTRSENISEDESAKGSNSGSR
jgi:hypothetical protein